MAWGKKEGKNVSEKRLSPVSVPNKNPPNNVCVCVCVCLSVSVCVYTAARKKEAHIYRYV